MEEPENIIHRVYREIGYPEPQVEQYPSFDDLVEDYTKWKDLARPIHVTYWSYNYPILNPYGLWTCSYLYNEGFQFDLTKKANKVECLNDPIYKSKIDIGPEILYEGYICAAIDAVLKNQEDEFRNKLGEVTSKTDNTKEEKFVPASSTLIPYNSGIPVVIYIPEAEGAEVRYRIWKASETTEKAKKG